MCLWRSLVVLVVLLGLAQAQSLGLGFKAMWPPEQSGLLAIWEAEEGLGVRMKLGANLQADVYWRLPAPIYGGAYVGGGLGYLSETLVLTGFLGYEWPLSERWALFMEAGPGYRIWLQPAPPGVPVFVHLGSGVRFKL